MGAEGTMVQAVVELGETKGEGNTLCVQNRRITTDVVRVDSLKSDRKEKQFDKILLTEVELRSRFERL